MGIKKVLPNIMKHVDKTRPHISPDKHAHEGLSVPEIVLKYGSILSKAKSLPRLLPIMPGMMKEMNRSYRELYKQPEIAKKIISEDHLTELESLGKEIGLGYIGFAKVDRSDIFDDKVILFPNAIIISMEMKHDIIQTVPSKAGEKEIFRTYYELNVAVNIIKDFLNEHGYNAEAGPALGGEANYPLLGEKAGLGCVGKHGLLITPEFGPSLRLAAVFTDIENLPMKAENEHLWIKEFCKTCGRCVKKCPASAIYSENKVFPDGSMECIDYKKCAVPFSMQKGCTVCVKECAFFVGEYEKIKRALSAGL